MTGDYHDWDIVSGVGLTALTVAAWRAVETNRPDGLVSDQYAEAFVNAANVSRPMPTRLDGAGSVTSEFARRWSDGAVFLGARSKFLDEYVEAACVTGVRQAVLLGAGLDTRAFRLNWPSDCTIFEIDQPQVLNFKDAVLNREAARPRCARRVVAVDLREDWPAELIEAGLDVLRPTVWLAEGLLNYLPGPAQQRLLERIHQMSARGSELAVDHAFLTTAQLEDLRNVSGLFGFDLSELLAAESGIDPSVYLEEQEWEVSTRTLSELIEPHRWRISGLPSPTQAETYFYTARLGRR